MHIKITKRVLECTLLPSSGSIFLRDTELRGFGARISAKGSITFFAEGRLRRSRNKRVSLGRYPVVAVENARERAREMLYQLSAGVDPVKESREKVEKERATHALEHACSVRLSQVMDDYFRSRRIKSEPDYRSVLNKSIGDWMECPVRTITRRDIETRYRKLAFRDGHKAQAAKTMRYLAAILNFAKAELVAGQPLLTDNPVNVLKDKKIDRTVKPRDNYIPKEKVAVVIRAILSECTITARDLLLLELFTGLRDGEAKSVKWSDVDFTRRVITIPETKNGKPHVFGMGQFVLSMMKHGFQHRNHNNWVFPNRRRNGPLGSIRKQLRRVHKTSGFTFTHHDLRRTFATLLSGELGISSDAIGRLLNHSPRGVTERHYIHIEVKKLTPIYDQLYRLVSTELEDLDLIGKLYPTSTNG